MTLADIPLADGAPDQGTEGIRFMGYTLYDPLIMWDLSSADRPAQLIPGLATAWHRDPADPTKWIFALRRGVRFHDGSEFNADAVLFNLDRALNDQSPATIARSAPKSNPQSHRLPAGASSTTSRSS
ncbi:MAG: ABC transporter substrate-binding protein [Pseudomonadota bacterium]